VLAPPLAFALEPYLHLPLIGLCIVGAMMLLLWIAHIPLKDAGIVDVGWTVGLVVLAGLYAVLGDGVPWRRGLIAAMVGVWGLRLATHLLRDRVVGKPEDGRYRAMRASLGDRFVAWMLPFFLAQGVLDVVLSAPFLLAARDPDASVRVTDVAGVAVFAIGFVGVAIADRQLAAWRADPSNRGKTCRSGLWSVSRHPNYFFEWILWCGYAVVATPAPYGWIAWTAPALILLFVTCLTGIPYTERQALKSRGDDYRDYQATTSAFLPWFRRNRAPRAAARHG
jgi:steroid 5-alpha reductase family enzyme